MKVEVRDDVAIIDGYVNVVERDSKVLVDAQGKFIEKMKSGVFQRALDRAVAEKTDVKVLLNHDYNRELTSTKDHTTELHEDAVGLRCHCEIRDADVVEKARNKKLVGWSFGFIALKQDRDNALDISHREVRDIILKEVSILDDTRVPAYDGTPIESRDYIEIRDCEEVEYSIREKDKPLPKTENDSWKYENKFLELRAGL